MEGFIPQELCNLWPQARLAPACTSCNLVAIVLLLMVLCCLPRAPSLLSGAASACQKNQGGCSRGRGRVIAMSSFKFTQQAGQSCLPGRHWQRPLCHAAAPHAAAATGVSRVNCDACEWRTLDGGEEDIKAAQQRQFGSKYYFFVLPRTASPA